MLQLKGGLKQHAEKLASAQSGTCDFHLTTHQVGPITSKSQQSDGKNPEGLMRWDHTGFLPLYEHNVYLGILRECYHLVFLQLVQFQRLSEGHVHAACKAQ